MKYYIQQKIFAIGDKFNIYDANENVAYTAESEIFAWGHKLHIYDGRGEEVGFVKQEIFTFMPKFEIMMQGSYVTKVVKRFTFFEQEYDMPELNWKILGDFTEHSYSVQCGDETIAVIDKKWFSFGDCYEIDVDNAINPLLVILCMLAVDCAECSKQ